MPQTHATLTLTLAALAFAFAACGGPEDTGSQSSPGADGTDAPASDEGPSEETSAALITCPVCAVGAWSIGKPFAQPTGVVTMRGSAYPYGDVLSLPGALAACQELASRASFVTNDGSHSTTYTATGVIQGSATGSSACAERTTARQIQYRCVMTRVQTFRGRPSTTLSGQWFDVFRLDRCSG